MAADSTQVPSVVYITGSERSGSTLLEMLLNAHPRVATCGEIHQWSYQLLSGGEGRCGCSHTIEDCEFWQALRRRVDPAAQPSPQLHHFHHPDSEWLRVLSRGLGQLRSFQLDGATRRQVATYADNSVRVFAAYRALWGERYGSAPAWLVDASKNPYRLWWLLESGRFRIKIVHLVRDPRGYVRSTGRLDAGDGIGTSRLRRILVQSLVWRFVNQVAGEVVARKARPADVLHVSYETLCREPERTLGRICGLLGLDYEPGMAESFRGLPCHTISGNQMRFEHRGIELDERWRTALTATEQRLVRTAARLPAPAVSALFRARHLQRALGARRGVDVA